MASVVTATITHQTIDLHRPLIHNGPEPLRDVTLRVADDFVPFPAEGAANMGWVALVRGATRIERVTVVGRIGDWLPRWHDTSDLSPGIPAWLGGLLVRGLTGEIRDVQVFGLPGRPLQVEGPASGVALRRFTSHRCFSGPRFGPTGAFDRLVVEDVTVGDCWGPVTGRNPELHSLVYPGAYTGGSTLILSEVSFAQVRNVRRLGGSEGKGVKIERCSDVLVADSSPGSTIQVAGSSWDGPLVPSERVLIRDCVIDFDLSVRRRPRNYNGLHVYRSHYVWIHNTELRGAGEGLNGVWSDASDVTVTQCRLSGWQQPFATWRNGGTIVHEGKGNTWQT